MASMLPNLSEKRVCDLVTEVPVRGAVFSQFGIDFCCGGKETLAQVCTDKNLNLSEITLELNKIDSMAMGEGENGLDQLSATELCDHIESTHHHFLRQHLPIISAHAEKVAMVHGEREPHLVEIRDIFRDLRAELEPHLLKEEQILFPLIRTLDGATTLPAVHCGSVQNPIRAMFIEHHSAGTALARLRELTNSYSPPSHACNTYRALFGELSLFEKDTHEHIHKENHVLFVKAQEIERALLEQT